MKLISESVVLHQSVSINQEFIGSGDYIAITAHPTIDSKPIDLGYGDYFFANPRLELGRNKLAKGIFIKIFCSESKQTRLSADSISGVFASLSVNKEKFDTLKFCALNNLCLTSLSLSFDQTKLEGIHEHKEITTIDGIEFSIGKEFEYSDLSNKKLIDSFNQAVDKKNLFLKNAYYSLAVVALLKIIFFVG